MMIQAQLPDPSNFLILLQPKIAFHQLNIKLHINELTLPKTANKLTLCLYDANIIVKIINDVPVIVNIISDVPVKISS